VGLSLQGGKIMSVSLINKTQVGKLFIANGKNYLVKEVISVNDETESIHAILVNSDGDEVQFNGGYSHWFDCVVK
jgi:hypothetical protein